jgi:hypothetical protein
MLDTCDTRSDLSGFGTMGFCRSAYGGIESKQTDNYTPFLTKVVSKILYPPEASRRNPFYSLTNFITLLFKVLPLIQ